MKRFISILVICASISWAQTIAGSGRIKTMSYWTSPVMNMVNARQLSRFDMVVADLDNQFNNPEALRELKGLNPKIKLICYSNPMEIFEPLVEPRPLQNRWSREILDKYPAWLLKTRSGKKAIFYPAMRMLNLSADCPRINGQTYGEYMANILVREVFKTAPDIWDGYFMDNCSPTIAWVAKPDDALEIPGEIDRSWSEGVEIYLKIIRKAMGDNFILIGNKGVTEYSDILQGRMFEWFPNDYVGSKTDGGWWSSMANAAENGPYTIFLLKPQDLDFGILSAQLLGKDVYIGVGNNSSRWYEQFDQAVGRPTEEIKVIRRFQNGTIEITPSRKLGKKY